MNFFIEYLRNDYVQALELLELAGEIAKIHNEKFKKMIEDREERERKMREMEAEMRLESMIFEQKNGKWAIKK